MTRASPTSSQHSCSFLARVVRPRSPNTTTTNFLGASSQQIQQHPPASSVFLSVVQPSLVTQNLSLAGLPVTHIISPRAHPSVTMGRILDLPEELVSNVASKLGCDDKCALRLTCRTLDERSFHEFGTEHFSEKGVHFNTDSLNTLVDISHSRLAKYVKEVSIVIALFSEQGFSCPGRETAHWRPSVRQSEAYKFYIQDQATLRSTGNDKKMLIEAFKSLPSLKVIEFVDTETALKPSVDYRGARKIACQTGK